MEEKAEDYRWKYNSFDFYKKPDNKDEWLKCPECRLKPRVWEFDNGRSAHCVCGKDRYHHKHQISAKPIGDYVRESGGFAGYDKDDLRKNWNNYIYKITKNYD